MIKQSMKRWTALALIIILMYGLQSAIAQEGAELKQQSLYNRLGGLAPISVVVSDFIDVLMPDPVLNENPAIDAARRRVPAPYLKYHVTALMCEAAGGPCRYHGRGMKEAHAHLNITEQEWNRMVTLFKEVLEKHKVPEKETQELLQIVGSTKADIVSGKQ
jgi:hemoglobin